MSLSQRIAQQEREIQIAQEAWLPIRLQFFKKEMEGEEYTDEQLAAMLLEEEWPANLRKSAPECSRCDFAGKLERDPYGTGDSPSMRECLAGECLWGKP